MRPELTVLLGTAVSIGFFHTLLGVDHYLPFIVMSKARKWSLRKTTAITLACGVGHVLSSVLLGLGGIALGTMVFKLEKIESVRGELAGWLLLIFGLAYLVWGARMAIRNRPHTHTHPHMQDDEHTHEHDHHDQHMHVHTAQGKATITPWILFTIFVFGPCEPLIPVLMYPAAQGSIFDVVLVTAAFSFATIGTMLTMVLALSFGLMKVPIGHFQRYSHAVAGLMIFLCGAAMTFLGI